jgi:hypothetical protein
MPLFIVTVPASRAAVYGGESRVQTVHHRARNRDEAIRVALHKIGPIRDEWVTGPNIGAYELPLPVARRLIAEVDGIWSD